MIDSLGVGELVFCAIVVTVAFAVRNGTGFGASTIAIPFLAFVMPIPVAVPVISVLIVFNSISLLSQQWPNVAWREVLRTVPFTLAGVVIGLYLMSHVDERHVVRALGGIVVLYAVYGLFIANRIPALEMIRWRSTLAAATGLAGGSIGALFGAGVGPIYAIYLNALKLDKDIFRVTVSSTLLVQLVARVSGYAALGYYEGMVLVALAAAVPFMFLGAWLGDRLVRRVDQSLFGQIVSVLLLISGFTLLVR